MRWSTVCRKDQHGEAGESERAKARASAGEREMKRWQSGRNIERIHIECFVLVWGSSVDTISNVWLTGETRDQNRLRRRRRRNEFQLIVFGVNEMCLSSMDHEENCNEKMFDKQGEMNAQWTAGNQSVEHLAFNQITSKFTQIVGLSLSLSRMPFSLLIIVPLVFTACSQCHYRFFFYLFILFSICDQPAKPTHMLAKITKHTPHFQHAHTISMS